MRHFWRLLLGISLLSLVSAHPALSQQVKLRDGTLLSGSLYDEQLDALID